MVQYLPFILLAVLCSSPTSCRAEGSGCGSVDQDHLAKQRLNNVLGSIQAQLAPLMQDNETEATVEDTASVNNDSVRLMYEALVNSTERVDDGSCKDGDFFAQPVTSFNVSMNIDKEATARRRRSAPTTATRGVLVRYTAELEFHLNDSLKLISRADLLLYQLPTRTSPSIQSRDNRQYIEISTVINDKERRVIEGKYIDTFGDGYIVFEITKAVEMWIQQNIEGQVLLEVVVYCYSSPSCAEVDSQGIHPAIVKFLTASQDLSKLPRVIVNSHKPRESVSRLNKRSTHNEEIMFCTSDADLCCLKPLVINFRTDLKLQSIVYPETFEANYCQGPCPTISGSTVLSSERFDFLSRLGSNHPAASIEPCCSGEEYDHLDVIMRVYNRETKRLETQIIKLNQVKVVGCRCA